MRVTAIRILSLFAIPLACPALEVSTGFLIGPKFDPRSFYVRSSPAEEWKKTNSGPGYRKTAQGKLLGVPVKPDAELSEVHKPWVTMISVPLQGEEGNSFDDRGKLLPARQKEIERLIEASNRASLVVELVLFDPKYDQEFFSPDEIVAAARNVTEWLIDKNYRNIIISFASDWTAQGWDFDNWVPLHLEQLATAVRDRFQARRTDFALPIAISVHVRLSADSHIIETADLLLLGGEAVTIDTSKIDRPALLIEESACVASFSRASGCVVPSPAAAAQLTPLLFTKPPVGQ